MFGSLLVIISLVMLTRFHSFLLNVPAKLKISLRSTSILSSTKYGRTMRAALQAKVSAESRLVQAALSIEPHAKIRTDLDEFKDAILKLRKINSPRKVLSTVQSYASNETLSHIMIIHAHRTLQKMNRTDLCVSLVPAWVNVSKRTACANIDDALVLVRGMCHLRRVDLAEAVAESVGIFTKFRDLKIGLSNGDIIVTDDALAANEKLLPQLALGHAYMSNFSRCISLLETMRLLMLPIDLETSKLILKHTLSESTSKDCRQMLRSLLYIEGLDDFDSIQMLANKYMKQIDFMKGAVSMATLPPAACPEVAFMGRSNVGKSSLINMICNRKGLAKTSKTPGKTSEFNYFDAKGAVGHNKEAQQFYIVDMPGVGYAEVYREKREGWLTLLREFATQRPTLRLLCHLVDSRHGLLGTDAECLNLLKTLPEHVIYCIVLTKADKRGGAVAGIIARTIRRLEESVREVTGYQGVMEAPLAVWNEELGKDEEERPTATTDQGAAGTQASEATEDLTSNEVEDLMTDGVEDLVGKGRVVGDGLKEVELVSVARVGGRLVPVLLTSSSTREGGARLLSLILDVVAGDSPSAVHFASKVRKAKDGASANKSANNDDGVQDEAVEDLSLAEPEENDEREGLGALHEQEGVEEGTEERVEEPRSTPSKGIEQGSPSGVLRKLLRRQRTKAK